MKKRKTVTTSTPENDEYIRSNYLSMSLRAMARHLGRSKMFVSTRMRQLDLKVPERIIEKRCSENKFGKGHIPSNKGRKMEEYMSETTIRKFRTNQYKKGQLPHNTMEIGDISTWSNKTGTQYYKIKIGHRKWVMLHRYNWEKKNGPIPKGTVLRCRDGNSLNADPENWEAISTKKNAQLNCGSSELADNFVLGLIAPGDQQAKDYIRENLPDLIELKRLQLTMNRKMKNHGQKQNNK